MKYKIYTLDEVLEFAKEHNIKVDESGYDIIPHCQSMFREHDDDDEEEVIEQGFFYVQDKDDASYLGGPFFHHFGFIRLYRTKDVDKLMTVEESIRDNFRWEMDLLKQFPHTTNSPIKLNQHLTQPTKENPYVIYICGNDDFSWTRTCSTEEAAKRIIFDLYLRCAKKDCGSFRHAIKDCLFHFTN